MNEFLETMAVLLYLATTIVVLRKIAKWDKQKREATQASWEKVYAENPSHHPNGIIRGWGRRFRLRHQRRSFPRWD